MKIIAKDEIGNEFNYEVNIVPSLYDYNRGEPMIDFGYPIQYALKDILKRYPLEGDLCIDGCGRNHKGSSVWVRKEDMNKLLATIQKKG